VGYGRGRARRADRMGTGGVSAWPSACVMATFTTYHLTSVPGEAEGPDSQQLVQVPLDELGQGRVTRLPRPVDPGGESPA